MGGDRYVHYLDFSDSFTVIHYVKIHPICVAYCLSIKLEEGEGNGILAWEIPWTEEPDELQSTESQKS